jgi:hypothetical protein
MTPVFIELCEKVGSSNCSVVRSPPGTGMRFYSTRCWAALRPFELSVWTFTQEMMTTPPNPPDPGRAGIMSPLTIDHHWPGSCRGRPALSSSCSCCCCPSSSTNGRLAGSAGLRECGCFVGCSWPAFGSRHGGGIGRSERLEGWCSWHTRPTRLIRLCSAISQSGSSGANPKCPRGTHCSA